MSNGQYPTVIDEEAANIQQNTQRVCMTIERQWRKWSMNSQHISSSEVDEN